MANNEMKKRLDSAYLWLSRVPVSGEAVDAMAMARQELRAAFSILTKQEQAEQAKRADLEARDE